MIRRRKDPYSGSESRASRLPPLAPPKAEGPVTLSLRDVAPPPPAPQELDAPKDDGLVISDSDARSWDGDEEIDLGSRPDLSDPRAARRAQVRRDRLQHAAEQSAAEQRAADERAALLRATELQAAEQRAAQARAAEERAAQVRAAQERAAQVRAEQARWATTLPNLSDAQPPADLGDRVLERFDDSYADWVRVLGEVRRVLGREGLLRGRRVVVTTGPTREALDPVRYISNRSTGKQGIAVAQAALDAGAEVTLIAGPIAASLPYGARVIPVETTQQMGEAVLSSVADADALFMVAAVADFRPEAVSDRKNKKTERPDWGLAIGLEKTLDILSAVKEQRDRTGYPRVVLGFAAETHNAFEYGRDKLLRKGLNFIAVNDVTADGAGFAVDTNQVVLLSSAGVVETMPLQSKTAIAERLIHHVAAALG